MGGSCILVKVEEKLVFSFFVLHCDRNYVLHCLYISCGNTALTLEKSASLGIYVLDHLDADGAGFAGGQVAVVALLKIYTDFLGSLHFELLHSLLCLRNVDLVITIAHFETLLCFLRKT